jgi:uncharacterized membrane protein
MKKNEFLAQLKRALGSLPEGEKKEILADYEEHFSIGLAEGKSEEEISRALGNPRVLGASFRIESMMEEGKSGWTLASILRAVFASLSLGFFNLVIVLGPFIGVVAVVISLWAVAASLALSGVAVLLGLIVMPILPQFLSTGGLSAAFLVFASIGTSGLGLLASIGMWYLSKWFIIAIAKYVQLNVRIVARRR